MEHLLVSFLTLDDVFARLRFEKLTLGPLVVSLLKELFLKHRNSIDFIKKWIYTSFHRFSTSSARLPHDPLFVIITLEQLQLEDLVTN